MASYNQFNYNYRPSKSIERKILIELLKEIYRIPVLDKTTYIGLGSIFFIDFKLIHKELGIKEMINIEGNISDAARFEYNKPFGCVRLEWGQTTDVLPNIDWVGNKIVWLDYDQTLQKYMFEDIETVFALLEPGSFYMATCNSSLPKYFDKKENIHNDGKFKKDFDKYAPFGLTPKMLTSTNSPALIRHMFSSTINYALRQRNSGITSDHEKLVFCQLLFINYKDGAPMLSFGGILKRKKDLKKLTKSNIFDLPYIRTSENPLNIEPPILTNSEIDLINSYLPIKSKQLLKKSELAFIPQDDKEKYLDIYRHYPSYVEIKGL